jgi:acetyl-CoA/propionyl-CoA carboxylase, biotin carboxylase, biotin carboxyl carrier protein
VISAPRPEHIAETQPTTITVEIDGRRIPVKVFDPSRRAAPKAPGHGPGAHHHVGMGLDAINSPMQGTILQILVEVGQEISVGDPVCILEAMKMENRIHANRDGVVKEIAVRAGQVVEMDQVLVVIGEDEEQEPGA